MHIDIMKNCNPICILLILLLALSSAVHANIADSALVHYRLSDKYPVGTVTWNNSADYYLALPAPPINDDAELFSLQIRKPDSKWLIIKYDPTIKIEKIKAAFSSIIPANNEWKFAPSMQAVRNNSLPIQQQTIRIVYASNAYKAEDVFIDKHAIIKKDYPDYNTADLFITDTETLRQIARNKHLVYISRCPSNVHTEQAVKRFDKGTNFIANVGDEMPGITGAGTVVSIKEDVFDTTDIDFKNRYYLTNSSSGFIDNHATIIASMIGGSGNTYYPGKGVAWQTSLTSANFSSLMPEPLSYYQQNNIDVQNHSYGTGIENEYAADAAAYDLTSWKDTTLLHIFSAGNSGTSSPTSGTYAGLEAIANITGSFKMSKNSMSIGGTDSFYQPEILSSKGPAYDGRIKPEIVAYGVDGTSGAAAIVTGTALLLQQQLKQQTGAKPAASLIKTLLINGSDDLADEGPDFSSGFGSLNASRSLQNAILNNFYTGTIKDGESQLKIINVPPNTAWLKVTLVWTDTPAAPLSATALVNDLDLSLQNINDGTIIKPWVLATTANKDSLQLPAVRGTDSLNTVEQTSILKPNAGDYSIVINGHNIVTNTQSYSVAWHTEQADSLHITYPTRTAAFIADSKQIVRWQSSFSNNTKASLAYKYADKDEWQLITDNLPLQQLWYQWQTPDTTAKALLRITIGTSVFTSDTIIISKPINLQVGYSCTDSLYLYWNKLSADKYRVYLLGDTLMQPLFITKDTFYKVGASVLKSHYISVAPLIEIMEAVRSYTIDYTKQGVGCYINNFLADLFGDSIRLQFTLGTLFGIKNVIVQKQLNGVFVNIDSGNATQLISNYSDNNLLQGGNTYRILVTLSNGTVIYSRPETIFYLDKKIYLLYPNPAKQQESIYVINRYYDGDLYANVYDITGRLLQNLSLNEAMNKVAINGLPTGIYIIEFNDGKKKLGVEKLIVQ